MNIYVLRHGQTDFNAQGRFQGRIDIELNDIGKKQIESTKKKLEKVNFDIAIVSPLKRAIQTAEIITKKELMIDNRLVERSFGRLEGKKSILNYEEQSAFYKIETIKNMKKRIFGFLNEIKSKYFDKNNILIVTHEAVAQIIDIYFCEKEDIKEFRIKNGEYVKYSILTNKEYLIQQLEKKELKRNVFDVMPQQFVKLHNKKNKLHIVYLMIWTKVCGGSKIILEYANRLSQKGHKITLISYDEKPRWFEMNEDIQFIQVSQNDLIENSIPDCDVIISTSWKNIYQAIKYGKAPAVFFEQGGSHIFDIENLSLEKYNAVKNRINLLSFIHTVSNYTKNRIKIYYKKDSEVIYNAIDSDIFYYKEKKHIDKINITIIGSEKFKFKNINETLKAIDILKKKYSNIELNWISQDKPQNYKGKIFLNPSQIEIGNILRKTDIYICNSDYESFCLPALEAMACGAAVITTDNGGISDFVVDNVNALVIKKHDLTDMIEKVETLINDEKRKNNLIKNGIETSKKFSWEESVQKMENYYKGIAQYKPINKKNI